jgi:hypothetical protein
MDSASAPIVVGMATWTVVQERVGDEDRLHVRAPDGSDAGWMSLRTGDVELTREFYRSGFTAAVADRRLESPAADGGEGSAPAAVDGATLVLTAVPRIVGQRIPDRTWGRPRTSERKVAAELDRLRPGWHVLDAVPIGPAGTAADHLVVGPGGVYSVNAENLPGSRVLIDGATFLVGGRPVPHLRRAGIEADRAGRLLTAACGFPVDVQGMLVLVGEVALTVRTPPTGVYVTTRRTVALDLTRMPMTLSAPVVDAIVSAARRPGTWSRP